MAALKNWGNAEGAVNTRTLEPATNDAVLGAGLDFFQALTKSTTLPDKFTIESGASDTLFRTPWRWR